MESSSTVYNPTMEEVRVQVYGNWFTFKPGQYKNFNKDIAEFMTIQKAYLGLVGIPAFILEEAPEVDAMDEAGKADYAARKKAALDEAKTVGVNRRIKHLKSIVTNLEVGLARDLIQTDHKIDPVTQASDGELEAYRQLAKYSIAEKDVTKAKVDEIKRLKEQALGHTDSTNA